MVKLIERILDYNSLSKKRSSKILHDIAPLMTSKIIPIPFGKIQMNKTMSNLYLILVSFLKLRVCLEATCHQVTNRTPSNLLTTLNSYLPSIPI